MSRKRPSRVAADHSPLLASMELVIGNEDLLMQILLFLPAKSLIRFKYVCKKWLSLISSDYFCHQHTLRRPKLQQALIIQMQSSRLFYLNGEKMMIPYCLSVLDSHQIVQACNGLLLLESRSHKKSYYVYNPTTRRLRKIILNKRGNVFPYVVALTLAFDPSKSPYYKLVCVRSTTAETINPAYYAYQIEVYDSESHTWKVGVEGSKYNTKIYDNTGVYWNNYIFWKTQWRYYFYFDIAKSEAKIVSFSRYPYEFGDNNLKFLQESNGHLYSFELLKSGAAVNGAVCEVTPNIDRSRWIKNYLGEIHKHPAWGSTYTRGAVCLMAKSGGDWSNCGVLVYKAARPRVIMAYNYLDQSPELVVDLTGQPVSQFDHPIKAFQFGEVLALV